MRIHKLGAAALALAATVAGLTVTAAPASAAYPFPPNTNNTKVDFGRWGALPFQNAVLPDGSVCPGGFVDTLTGPKGGDTGYGAKDGFGYYVLEGGIADVTGDGYLDQVVRVGCHSLANPGSGMNYYYLYSFWKAPYGPGLRPINPRFITSEHEAGSPWVVTDMTPVTGAINVAHRIDTEPDEHQRRVFTVDEDRAVADRPLKDYPQADTAPPVPVDE